MSDAPDPSEQTQYLRVRSLCESMSMIGVPRDSDNYSTFTGRRRCRSFLSVPVSCVRGTPS